MAIWLEQSSSDFEQAFAAFLTTKREVSEDVNVVVRDIIEEVRKRGDEALAHYSLKFDGLDFSKISMPRCFELCNGWNTLIKGNPECLPTDIEMAKIGSVRLLIISYFWHLIKKQNPCWTLILN